MNFKKLILLKIFILNIFNFSKTSLSIIKAFYTNQKNKFFFQKNDFKNLDIGICEDDIGFGKSIKYEKSLSKKIQEKFLKEKEKEKVNFFDLNKLIFSGFFKNETIKIEEPEEESKILEKSEIFILNNGNLEKEEKIDEKDEINKFKKKLEDNLKLYPHLNYFYKKVLEEKNIKDKEEYKEFLINFLNTFYNFNEKDELIVVNDLSPLNILEFGNKYIALFDEEFEDFKKKRTEKNEEIFRKNNDSKKILTDFFNKMNNKSCICGIVVNHNFFNEYKDFFKKDKIKNFESISDKNFFLESSSYIDYLSFMSILFPEYYKIKEKENFEKAFKIIYPNFFKKKNKIDDFFQLKDINNSKVIDYTGNKKKDSLNLELEKNLKSLKEEKGEDYENYIKNNYESLSENIKLELLKEKTEKILEKNEHPNFKFIYYDLLKLNENEDNEKLFDFASIFYSREGNELKIRKDIKFNNFFEDLKYNIKYKIENLNSLKEYYKNDLNKNNQYGSCTCDKKNPIIEKIESYKKNPLEEFKRDFIINPLRFILRLN